MTLVRFTVQDGTCQEAEIPPPSVPRPDRPWRDFLHEFDSNYLMETTKGEFVRLRYIVRAWEPKQDERG